MRVESKSNRSFNHRLKWKRLPVSLGTFHARARAYMAFRLIWSCTVCIILVLGHSVSCHAYMSCQIFFSHKNCTDWLLLSRQQYSINSLTHFWHRYCANCVLYDMDNKRYVGPTLWIIMDVNPRSSVSVEQRKSMEDMTKSQIALTRHLTKFKPIYSTAKKQS